MSKNKRSIEKVEQSHEQTVHSKDQKKQQKIEIRDPTTPDTRSNDKKINSVVGISHDQDITQEEAAQYDRQIRLWGFEVQNRIKKASVAIIGLNGMTTEIIKNLALVGVGRLLLIDYQLVKEKHLGSEFFLRKEFIGKSVKNQKDNKVDAYAEKAKLLNPRVQIDTIYMKIDDIAYKDLEGCQYAFFSTRIKNQMIKISELCSENNIKLWIGSACGWIGFFFCDLMEHQYLQKSKSQSAAGGNIVETSYRLKISYSRLKDIFYPNNLSGLSRRVLQRASTLLIILNQENYEPLVISSSIEDKMKEFMDKMKLSSPNLLSEEPLETLLSQWHLEISPVCAIMGGIVTQELVKAISENGAPINNTYTFDAMRNEDSILKLF